MSITLSLQEFLIGILLIALIVLVVYLIVLVSNASDTVKRVNAIIDGGTAAASSAIAKMDEATSSARRSAAKAGGIAEKIVGLAQSLLNRFTDWHDG